MDVPSGSLPAWVQIVLALVAGGVGKLIFDFLLKVFREHRAARAKQTVHDDARQDIGEARAVKGYEFVIEKLDILNKKLEAEVALCRSQHLEALLETADLKARVAVLEAGLKKPDTP